MANVPAELGYTREHEWAKVEGDRARVGITAFGHVFRAGSRPLISLDPLRSTGPMASAMSLRGRTPRSVPPASRSQKPPPKSAPPNTA